MFSILVASFVIVCCLIVITSVPFVLRQERQKRLESEIILAAESLRPEWIYGERMDIPQKYPLLRTRSSKVIR